MRANDALLHVLRQLASRQSIHCGPDQGRGVVRRGGCSSGGGLTGFAGVAWISMGRLSRSSPKSSSLSFSLFSFTNVFASCSSIGGRTSVESCRCRDCLSQSPSFVVLCSWCRCALRAGYFCTVAIAVLISLFVLSWQQWSQ